MNASRAILATLLLLVPAMGLATAAERAPSDPLAAYPPGSVLLEDGAIAIPARADPPTEYTPEVHEKVLAAAAKGMGYDYVNDREVMFATNFLFIRPGAWMFFPSWCTMNFIYGSPGAYKIGSAGHCNAVGTHVVVIAYPGVLANIGQTSVSHNNGPGDDYSFTPILPAFQAYVDPNVADIGGPQGGAFTGSASLTKPVAAKQFGHGVGIGTSGTSRVGLATKVDKSSTVQFALPVVFGDSGGPMLAVSTQYPLGQALAVVTHLVVGGIGYTGLGTRVASLPETVVNGDVNPLP